MAHLELYELPGCPHCAAVRDALADLELEYESITVPRNHGKRGDLAELTGQTCVPVLVDHDNGVEVTPQDGDAVGYLVEAYGDGAEGREVVTTRS